MFSFFALLSCFLYSFCFFCEICSHGVWGGLSPPSNIGPPSNPELLGPPFQPLIIMIGVPSYMAITPFLYSF